MVIRVTEEVRGHTRLTVGMLTKVSLEDRSHPLGTMSLKELELLFHALTQKFTGHGVGAGALISLRSNGKIEWMLFGLDFTPEQMYFQFDAAFKDLVFGEDVIYVHSHDETYRQEPLMGGHDHGLHQQLFPTDLDAEFIANFVAEAQPATVSFYTIGSFGAARIYPGPESDLYAPTFSEAKRQLFLLRLKMFLRAQELWG